MKIFIFGFNQSNIMMVKPLLTFALICCFFSDCCAQQFVKVIDQLFTVHSAGNILVNSNSNSRNVIEVRLPANCIGYVYRVTTSQKNFGTDQSSDLAELLKGLMPGQLVMGAVVGQFVIQQADGQAIDMFSFNNAADATRFLQKQSFQACWDDMGVINTCFARNDCISPTLYFGFRNNNMAKGVNVHLEIVAVVSNSGAATERFNYSITNSINKNLDYMMSGDGVKWKSFIITAGNTFSFTSKLSKLYFRLTDSDAENTSFEIRQGQRYQIILNANGRFDLTTN